MFFLQLLYLQIGKAKAMKKVKDWSSHIIRHFWHCSSLCRSDNTTSDEEALKVMKVQHVCYFVNRKNAKLIPYNQLLSNFI